MSKPVTSAAPEALLVQLAEAVTTRPWDNDDLLGQDVWPLCR